MMRSSALQAGIFASFAIVGVGLALSSSMSCASLPDPARSTVVLQPDYPIYKAHVDAFLTRRCGSLDCHGQPGRAYRIYSREGLRLLSVQDGGLVSGQQPITEDETRANFQAFVALEPEEMSRLIATQGEDPNRLLALRKPLRLERHKGGPAMAEDDSGYKCVVAWLRVPTIRFDAAGTPQPVPQAERVMPQRAIDYCVEAQSYP